MIEGIPRISVRVITYKQEVLIKRAINSLLSQKDYIYEICVTDDCSPDGTWDVLQQYSKDYPGLFKLNRNEHNLGIFENIEKSWSMVSGDLVFGIAGDDEAGEGWLKSIVDFIQENNIDYKNEAICIYGDFKAVYPNGDNIIITNRFVKNQTIDLFSLAIRHIIYNRSACSSIKVKEQFIKVSQGRSHIAEEILDRQLQIISKKNYYISHIGNIYHVGIGVSAKMDGKQIDVKTHNERQELAEYTIRKAAELGYKVREKDKNYLYFTRALFQARYTYKISDFYKAFVFYIKSYDSRIGLKGLRFKRIVFALRRRLPHTKPITMTV